MPKVRRPRRSSPEGSAREPPRASRGGEWRAAGGKAARVPRVASSGCAPASASGLDSARQADARWPGSIPLGPQRAHTTGWAGPLGAPETCSALQPLRPSLTVSAALAPRRDATGTARSPQPFPQGAPALSPPGHAAPRRRKAATLAPLLRVPDRSRSTSAAEPALGGRRGRRCTDCWGGSPAVTAPLQPRSSLPLRVAPAFCFTRGTTNAAAAMLTTEPGGGAHGRRA